MFGLSEDRNTSVVKSREEDDENGENRTSREPGEVMNAKTDIGIVIRRVELQYNIIIKSNLTSRSKLT